MNLRVLLPTVSFFPVLALAPAGPAQTGTPGEPAARRPPEVVRVGKNTFSLRWHGVAGRTYFVQSSADLLGWRHMPVIKSGQGAPLTHNFSGDGSRMFVRLSHTDRPTTSPHSDDFDGDGISNWNEIRPGGTGTDPFLWDTDGDNRSDYFADTDGNGVADGWETTHFGGVGTVDPAADPDGDGRTNAQESWLGTSPFAHAGTNDQDKDGLVDAVDAVPDDALINWPKTPLPRYALVDIGKPPGAEHAPLLAISEAGYVLAAADLDGSVWGYIQNYVWQPDTGTWSGPLSRTGSSGTGGGHISATDVGADGRPGEGRLLVTGTHTWVKQGGKWHQTRRRISGWAVTPRGIILTGRKGESNKLWLNGRDYTVGELCPQLVEDGYKFTAIHDINDSGVMLCSSTKPGGGNTTVLLVPVEITAAFGVGPESPEGGGDKSSRDLLEEYLDGIKLVRQGNVWALKGKDTQGNDKIWGVEVVSDQDKLNKALGSRGRYVVFDGHSNFGLGPDFGGKNITGVADLTNYGSGYTDVPLNFRLRGDASDPAKWGVPFVHMQVGNGEIPAAPKNYKPLPLDVERFPNIDGIGAGQAFQRQGQGFGTWHYRIRGDSKRLIINAPKTDLPANLAYKTFFYNACNTGIDYIENFKQGDFIYTNKSCFVHKGTRIFVQGVVEGKTTAQIMSLLNQLGVGSNNPNDIVYEFKSF